MPGVRGKLLMAPLWDYNIAFGNANYIQGWLLDIWNWKRDSSYPGACTDWLPKAPTLCDSNCCVANPMNNPMLACTGKCWNMPYLPWYWQKLLAQPAFQNAMKCRWQELRKNVVTMEFIEASVKRWHAALGPLAVPRHFAQWPDLRKPVWPNPCELDAATGKLKTGTANRFRMAGLPDPNCGSPTGPATDFFDYETAWLLAWTRARIDWLDRNLPGTCAAPR
jgi:hypothetical protein